MCLIYFEVLVPYCVPKHMSMFEVYHDKIRWSTGISIHALLLYFRVYLYFFCIMLPFVKKCQTMY